MMSLIFSWYVSGWFCWLWVSDRYFGSLFFFRRDPFLPNGHFDMFGAVVFEESPLAATIDVEFGAKVIGINEPSPIRSDPNPNEFWIRFFSLARLQWCMASIAFQLGSLPGMMRVIVWLCVVMGVSGNN